MADQIFYVGAQDRKDRAKFTGYVPAKFLMRNGRYVMDAMPGGSQKAFLYSDASERGKTTGRIANPYNYLIVPDIHTEQKAKDFAARIADSLGNSLGDETGGALALPQALASMATAFWPDGPQDMQRNLQWGVPKGSFVPAFTGSTSDHLGYITALGGLPKLWSEIAGGQVNKRAAAGQKLTDPPIDISGPHGLSWHNYHNIVQGFSDGLAASKSPSPFNDYGYGPQAKSDAGQVGDGNGIADWQSSLAGVDPQEPTQPAWPPLVDRPIRYLGRRAQ